MSARCEVRTIAGSRASRGYTGHEERGRCGLFVGGDRGLLLRRERMHDGVPVDWIEATQEWSERGSIRRRRARSGLDVEHQVSQALGQVRREAAHDLYGDIRRHGHDRRQQVLNITRAASARDGHNVRGRSGPGHGRLRSTRSERGDPEPRTDREHRDQCDRNECPCGAGSEPARRLSQIGSWRSSKARPRCASSGCSPRRRVPARSCGGISAVSGPLTGNGSRRTLLRWVSRCWVR